MAPGLRYINKLSGHLINSKHLGILQPKIAIQCQQYSRSVQPEYKIQENVFSDSNVENNLVDNREAATDVTTKINIDRLTPPEKLYSTETLTKNTLLSKTDSEEPSSKGRPSPDKLLKIYNILADSLPKLFTQPLDYSFYHDQIVFEDRIRNVRTVGLGNYSRQVAILRTVGHFKFAFVRFEILKITQHPEDGTVRVRWRIKGISSLKVMIFFWKYKLWQWKEMFEKAESWYDGYSTFYVNGDGMIVKHLADKMMPDSDEVTDTGPIGNLGSAKLALMVALIPRFSEAGWFI